MRMQFPSPAFSPHPHVFISQKKKGGCCAGDIAILRGTIYLSCVPVAFLSSTIYTFILTWVPRLCNSRFTMFLGCFCICDRVWLWSFPLVLAELLGRCSLSKIHIYWIIFSEVTRKAPQNNLRIKREQSCFTVGLVFGFDNFSFICVDAVPYYFVA